jgi:DNA polymerase III alpha subunit (gram-positive type)
MINYIAFDTETGGLDPFRNPLLQIGCYAPNGDSLNVRVIPPVHLSITEQAKKVNGWPDSHKGYPVYDESAAIDQFQEFMARNKPQWILCHNAIFDIPFIREAIHRTNKKVYIPKALCTMSFAKALEYVGGYNGPSYTLNDLIKEFAPEYNRPNTHDASEDAKATHLVFQGMLYRFDGMAKLANNVAMDRMKEIEQNSTGVVQTTEPKPIKSFVQGNRWGRSGR